MAVVRGPFSEADMPETERLEALDGLSAIANYIQGSRRALAKGLPEVEVMDALEKALAQVYRVAAVIRTMRSAP